MDLRRICSSYAHPITRRWWTGCRRAPRASCAMRGSARYDGFVALGCVVKGETDHYDYICSETMAGLMHVALQYGIALGTGVLTVHTVEQAMARSGPGRHNKGAEA